VRFGPVPLLFVLASACGFAQSTSGGAGRSGPTDARGLLVAASSATSASPSALAGPATKLPAGSVLVLQTGHGASVYSAAFSKDGSLLATGDQRGVILISDAATGEIRARLSKHTAQVTCLAFSDDGARLASGGEDGQAIVWDLKKAEPLSTSTVAPKKILDIALSSEPRQPRGLCVRVLSRRKDGRRLERLEGGRRRRRHGT
jgi:WD40 repeat protein